MTCFTVRVGRALSGFDGGNVDAAADVIAHVCGRPEILYKAAVKTLRIKRPSMPPGQTQVGLYVYPKMMKHPGHVVLFLVGWGLAGVGADGSRLVPRMVTLGGGGVPVAGDACPEQGRVMIVHPTWLRSEDVCTQKPVGCCDEL
jgi:hypothetical protein